MSASIVGEPLRSAGLLVMESSSSMSATARVALFVLIGLLLVTLGFIAFALFTIRRRQPTEPARAPQPDIAEAPDDTGEPMVRMAAPARSRQAVAVGGGGLAVAEVAEVADATACPTCRREYDGGLVYCPHDARKLVPMTEMLTRARNGGSVCPRCRRAFDSGVRFCPHDATELVPLTLYETTRSAKSADEPTGIMAKICPQCRRRYDLAATFCGKDGSELQTVN